MEEYGRIECPIEQNERVTLPKYSFKIFQEQTQ
jgi:hypothetical protein